MSVAAATTYQRRNERLEPVNDLMDRMVARMASAMDDIETPTILHSDYMNALDEIKVLSRALEVLGSI